VQEIKFVYRPPVCEELAYTSCSSIDVKYCPVYSRIIIIMYSVEVSHAFI